MAITFSGAGELDHELVSYGYPNFPLAKFVTACGRGSMLQIKTPARTVHERTLRYENERVLASR